MTQKEETFRRALEDFREKLQALKAARLAYIAAAQALHPDREEAAS